MDESSPFKYLEQKFIPSKSSWVHVLFCDVCHYVWKAPAASDQCINCKNVKTAHSLVSYKTEAMIM